MSRIELDDTQMSALIKMADGNPGAITAMTELMKQGGEIDPDAAFGGFHNIFSLDTHEIYGSDIWVFYKDVSQHSIETMIGCTRAVQLGIKPESWLKDYITKGQTRGVTEEDYVDIAEAIKLVKEQLPKFGQAA